MAISTPTVPEQVIAALMKAGITAINDDGTVLDDILGDLSANDLTTAKARWASNPPSVVSGYARTNMPFPVWAIVLMNETIIGDYVGMGEEAYIGGGVKDGNVSKRRVQGQFGLFVYAEHPDLCSWWYRVLRRILNVGHEWLIDKGLNDPMLVGTELAPDPRYTPENLFTRRLTLQVEYEERWRDQDALAVALLPIAEEYLTSDGDLDIAHEDAGGSVSPYTE